MGQNSMTTPFVPNLAYGPVGPTPDGAGAFETTLDLVRALKPETPVFCVSSPTARAHIQTIIDAFPARLLFAVKACPLHQVIKLAVEGGIKRYDVASLSEIELVRRVSQKALLFYNNPIRSPHEIQEALYTHGVRRFAVDDHAGLEELSDALVGKPKREKTEVAVRLRTIGKNAGGHDFTRKFGAVPSDAIDIVRAADRMGLQTSLTFHPGSQCADPNAYFGMIKLSKEIAAESGVKISAVNVGGGFPAPYGTLTYAETMQMFRSVHASFKTVFRGKKVKVRAEPGRAVAAPIVSIVTRVKHIRSDGAVFINDGIFGAFAEFEYIDMRLPTRFWREDGEVTGKTKPVEVYGPTCDPCDAFPYRVDVPQSLKVGDWIEFGLIGGYGPSTVTRFNGYGEYRIAEVAQTINATIVGTDDVDRAETAAG